MPGKITLSETEFLAIANAARALVPNDQPAFFQTVSDELQGKLIGDGTIGQAIRNAQARSAGFRPTCRGSANVGSSAAARSLRRLRSFPATRSSSSSCSGTLRARRRLADHGW